MPPTVAASGGGPQRQGSQRGNTAAGERGAAQRSDKPSTATFTLNFTAPGSLPVTYDWLLKGPADGWVVLQVILPEKANSGKVRFQVKCGK